MHIRAPSGGSIAIEKTQDGNVLAGDILFQIDKSSAELDLERAKTAVSVLSSALDRLDWLESNGILDVHKAAIESAQRTASAFEKVYESRKEKYLFGLTQLAPVPQAVYFCARSQAHIANEKLSQNDVLLGISESRVQLEKLALYVDAVLKSSTKRLEQLTIRAPMNGFVHFVQRSPGYVVPGDILATYRRSAHPTTKAKVLAPSGGTLISTEVADGAIVKAGEVIARMDPTDEELQLLRVEILSTQFSLVRRRLSQEHYKFRQAAIDSRVAMVRAQHEFYEVVRKTEQDQHAFGLTDEEVLNFAIASHEYSGTELAKAEFDSKSQRVVVDGIMRNLALFDELLSKQKKLISNHLEQRIIRAPIGGTLIWYAFTDSYIEAGTPLAAIS